MGNWGRSRLFKESDPNWMSLGVQNEYNRPKLWQFHFRSYGVFVHKGSHAGEIENKGI